MENDQKKSFLYALGLGTQMGLLVALPLIVFLFLGIFLDKKFDTAPLFLISLVIFSIVVTIFDVRCLILPFIEKNSQKNNQNNQNKK
ncbi:MAG: AtpZ/AtpI family protein [Candidatus Paceibacterota bacterium]|jgi:F0F1-type ATP synthase assembly protein I